MARELNGYVPFKISEWEICSICFRDVWEGHPHCEDGINVYCSECSFRMGLISEKTFLSNHGIEPSMFRAAISPDGNIHIGTWKVLPWERTNKQDRHSTECTNWRIKVFERDDYTCKICGKRGGELNAHHIKPFSKFKRLRYEVENGITLCNKCHRKVHRSEIECPILNG